MANVNPNDIKITDLTGGCFEYQGKHFFINRKNFLRAVSVSIGLIDFTKDGFNPASGYGHTTKSVTKQYVHVDDITERDAKAYIASHPKLWIPLEP